MARRYSRLAVIASIALLVLIGLAPATAFGQDSTPMAAPLPDGIAIVANGLDNPRNFIWDDDGTLYLAIAGTGGTSMGMVEGVESGLVGGMTASVVTLADGCATLVADGLPSGLWQGVGWVWGTADVAFLDGQLYQLASAGGSDYGNFDTPAGLYRIEDDGSSTLVFDFSTWSRENEPEFLPPDMSWDGTLNDMFAGEDGQFWIVDPVSGRIFTVTSDGEVALFSDYSVDHPVPTSLVPDGEGGLYVGNLTAIPYPEGEAKVVNIAADGTVEDVWTGLTAVTGIAMGPDGTLYASEMATGVMEEDPFLAPNSGRVVRQAGPDRVEEVVTGLAYPVAIGFGPDGALHIAGPAFGTGDGGGQGWVLRVDPAASLPVSLAGVDLTPPTCAGESGQASAAPEAGGGDTAESAAVSGTTPLMQIPLSAEMVGTVERVGITRMTLDPGATQQVGAGSGANVMFVEEGALTLAAADAAVPISLFRAGMDASEPEVSSGGDVALQVGDAFVVPPGGEATISNAGDAPANVLSLLSAGDARMEAAPGVTHSMLAAETDLTVSPGVISLEEATIPGGGRLELPAAPVQSILVGQDMAQSWLLSGRREGTAINRGDMPVDAYLLTLAPAP